jgi:hypothetical protein
MEAQRPSWASPTYSTRGSASTEKDGELERKNCFEGWRRGDVYKVKRIFAKLDVPLDTVKIVPKWLENTLRTAPVDRVGILHINADCYGSVKLVLDVFYDEVI